MASGCTDWASGSSCSGGLVCKLGDCSACASHSECSSTQICNYVQDVRGRCVTATGRQWDVYVTKVTFPQYDSTGALWDPGGFPDPRIEIEVNDTYVGHVTFDDTYSVDRSTQAFTPIRISLPAETTSLSVTAYDEDVTSNDYADGTKWTQAISLARQYGYAGLLYGQRVSVTFSIVPVP